MIFRMSFLLCFCFTSTFAETSQEKGLRIAKQMEEKAEGFIGEKSKMTMVLINAYGEKIEREMIGLVKEIKGDGNWSLSEFLTPSDVKGTKMLTWSYKTKKDKQWLFLPSIKRVKRISSNNRFASFMGSEFTYEDLGSQELEKYNFNFIKETKDSWLLERTPKEKSGYKKQSLLVSKKYFVATKVEYFDRRGELLKVSISKDFQKYMASGKEFWKANRVEMENVQTNKKSHLIFSDRKIGMKISKKKLSKKALK